MTEANMCRAWASVTAEDRATGARSYPAYHATLRAFAALYQAPFVGTVEAFAALSPNNDYHGNLRSLASLLYARATGAGLDSATVSTYRACAVRAWGYLTGEVSFLDTVGGRKITSFRHNLLYPDTSNRVTVDGHMVAVWVGKELTMREAVHYLNGQIYDAIERTVRSVARAEGLPAPAVQATLWVHRKRTRGILFSTQQGLFDGLGRWEGLCLPVDYPPFSAGRDWQEWVRARA